MCCLTSSIRKQRGMIRHFRENGNPGMGRRGESENLDSRVRGNDGRLKAGDSGDLFMYSSAHMS